MKKNPNRKRKKHPLVRKWAFRVLFVILIIILLSNILEASEFRSAQKNPKKVVVTVIRCSDDIANNTRPHVENFCYVTEPGSEKEQVVHTNEDLYVPGDEIRVYKLDNLGHQKLQYDLEYGGRIGNAVGAGLVLGFMSWYAHVVRRIRQKTNQTQKKD